LERHVVVRPWLCRGDGRRRVGRSLEITAVGRTRHGPKNVYYFSISFSLDLDFSSTRLQRRRKRIFKVHHRERISLTCISIVESTAVGTQYCCFYNYNHCKRGPWIVYDCTGIHNVFTCTGYRYSRSFKWVLAIKTPV